MPIDPMPAQTGRKLSPRKFTSLLLLSLLIPGKLMAKDPYERISEGLAAAAAQAGVKSAQLLPLIRADNKITPEGRMISARLLTHIMKQKNLTVVIGEFPESTLEPYLTGLDATQEHEFVKRLGLPPEHSSDMVILGSYLMASDHIELNIQAILLRTGNVLFAATEDVKNEWPLSWSYVLNVSGASEDSGNSRKSPITFPRPALDISSHAAVGQLPPHALQESNINNKQSEIRDAVKTRPKIKAVPVEFRFKAEQAQKIELVGGFLFRSNGKAAMVKDAQGLWKLEVYLTPGSYRYYFLVDGRQKKIDDENPRRERGASIITIP